ncbi:rhodanese-like domain-containing protein [Enterococcus dongliensis]|uniref:rhodanese-like domain-containing protein n=1 Tax=Enterococcus dongliensis TaxID=2559925 RepID=UPI00289206AB|nr:rhodanese-like domain-containing protein [Enterococcus dongliensis]MDT2613631.1 rhodanese-like domain-containing protein [Enterococcus dongliensis]MDT2640993.1 rhodanese-like domain-containing protein [Enterococcus dongliensis]MDT2670276.1 rhodanese-like domain-containing protein [Enterococcus dongliensis]MDT2674840.1 rhodanese-like domain-containing protein [Enterococcus dongliensis]
MNSTITMADFYQLTKQKTLEIIDVREDYEYQMGHIPHAKNFPLSNLGETMSELDSEKELYLVCQSGARSENASAFLSSQGYNVINVSGGTMAWPEALRR